MKILLFSSSLLLLISLTIIIIIVHSVDASAVSWPGACYTNCGQAYATPSNCTADSNCMWDRSGPKCRPRCESIPTKGVCKGTSTGTTASVLDVTHCYWDIAADSCFTDCKLVTSENCHLFDHCARSHIDNNCYFKCTDREPTVNTSAKKIPTFGFKLTHPRGSKNASYCADLYGTGSNNCFFDSVTCQPPCGVIHDASRDGTEEGCTADSTICFWSPYAGKCKDSCTRFLDYDTCTTVVGNCRWSWTRQKCYDQSQNLFQTSTPDPYLCMTSFPDRVDLWYPTGACNEKCNHADGNVTECLTDPILKNHCDYDTATGSCFLSCENVTEADCKTAAFSSRCQFTNGKCRRRCTSLSSTSCDWYAHCIVSASTSTCILSCNYNIPIARDSAVDTIDARCAADATCEMRNKVCSDKCLSLARSSCIAEPECSWMGSTCENSCSNNEVTNCDSVGTHCSSISSTGSTGDVSICYEKCDQVTGGRDNCLQFEHCEWTSGQCSFRCSWFPTKTSCLGASTTCEFSVSTKTCHTLCSTLDAISCMDRVQYPYCTNETVSGQCEYSCGFRYNIEDEATCIADSNCEYFDTLGCGVKCSRITSEELCVKNSCVWNGNSCSSSCAKKYKTSARCAADTATCESRYRGPRCENKCSSFTDMRLCKALNGCWWHRDRNLCFSSCRDRYADSTTCQADTNCMWSSRGCEFKCSVFSESRDLCTTTDVASHCNWTVVNDPQLYTGLVDSSELGSLSVNGGQARSMENQISSRVGQLERGATLPTDIKFTCVARCNFYTSNASCVSAGLGCSWLFGAGSGGACTENCASASSMHDCDVFYPRCSWQISAKRCVPSCGFSNDSATACGSTPWCEWGGASLKCNSRCASLSSSQCSSATHCSYRNNLCLPADCSVRQNQAVCEFGDNSCKWIGTSCYAKCALETGSTECSSAGAHCEWSSIVSLVKGSPAGTCSYICSWYHQQTGQCPTDGTCESYGSACERACILFDVASCPIVGAGMDYCYIGTPDSLKCRPRCHDPVTEVCLANRSSVCEASAGTRKCIQQCGLLPSQAACGNFMDCMWDALTMTCTKTCENMYSATPTSAYELQCNSDVRCEWVAGTSYCARSCDYLERSTGSCASTGCERNSFLGKCVLSCSGRYLSEAACTIDSTKCRWDPVTPVCSPICETQTVESCPSLAFCSIIFGSCQTPCSNYDNDVVRCETSTNGRCYSNGNNRCLNNCSRYNSSSKDECESYANCVHNPFDHVQSCWSTNDLCLLYGTNASQCALNLDCWYSTAASRCVRKPSYFGSIKQKGACTTDSSNQYVWRSNACDYRCFLRHQNTPAACNGADDCIYSTVKCLDMYSRFDNETCREYNNGNACEVYNFGPNATCSQFSTQVDCEQFSQCQFNATTSACQVRCGWAPDLASCNAAPHCVALGKWDSTSSPASQCVAACSTAPDMNACTNVNPYSKYCKVGTNSFCFTDCHRVEEKTSCQAVDECRWMMGACRTRCDYQQTQSNCEASPFCKWRNSGGGCGVACERITDVGDCRAAQNDNWCIVGLGGRCRTRCDKKYITAAHLYACDNDINCEIANYTSSTATCIERCSTVNESSCVTDLACEWSTLLSKCIRGCTSYDTTMCTTASSTAGVDCRVANLATVASCRPKCSFFSTKLSCQDALCFWSGNGVCQEDCNRMYGSTKAACVANTDTHNCMWDETAGSCQVQCENILTPDLCDSSSCVFRDGKCRRSCSMLYGVNGTTQCRLHAECQTDLFGTCIDACYVYDTETRCTTGNRAFDCSWVNNTCMQACGTRFDYTSCAGTDARGQSCDWLGSTCVTRCQNFTDVSTCDSTQCEWHDNSYCRRSCEYLDSFGDAEQCEAEGHCKWNSGAGRCEKKCKEHTTVDFCIAAGNNNCQWVAGEFCRESCSQMNSMQTACTALEHCTWEATTDKCLTNCSHLTTFFSCEADEGSASPNWRCSWDFARSKCRLDCNHLHKKNATTCLQDDFCTWNTKHDLCEKKCSGTSNYGVCSSGQANCVWLGKTADNKFGAEFISHDWVRKDQKGNLIAKLSQGLSTDLVIVTEKKMSVDGANITRLRITFDGDYDKLQIANETANRATKNIKREARDMGYLDLKPSPEYIVVGNNGAASLNLYSVIVGTIMMAIVAVLF